MIELPEIAIYSDGCRLCEQALAVMRSAAGTQADHVVEKPISNASPNEIAELGIRSAPSIVFNEMIAAAGIPSVEEAAGLIKRAQLDRGIQRYAIPKSKAMQNFAEGKIPTEVTARAPASEFYPFSEESHYSYRWRSVMSEMIRRASCWFITCTKSTAT